MYLLLFFISYLIQLCNFIGQQNLFQFGETKYKEDDRICARHVRVTSFRGKWQYELDELTDILVDEKGYQLIETIRNYCSQLEIIVNDFITISTGYDIMLDSNDFVFANLRLTFAKKTKQRLLS